MNTDKIISFLTDNPGATAKEIGCTPVELARLEAKFTVVRCGTRSSGGRGRPSVEWALPGQKVAPQEEREYVTPMNVYTERADQLEKLGELVGGELQNILNSGAKRFRKPMTNADATFLNDTMRIHMRQSGRKINVDTLELA